LRHENNSSDHPYEELKKKNIKNITIEKVLQLTKLLHKNINDVKD